MSCKTTNRASSRMLAAAGLLLAVSGCGSLNLSGFAAAPRSPIPDTMPTGQATAGEDIYTSLAREYAPSVVTACIRMPTVECRNKISQSLILAIDLRYADYELEAFDTGRYANFTATAVGLGLTGAASVSPAGAAHVLAAIATGIAGGREAFNKDVLQAQTQVALVAAMRSQRDRINQTLRTNLAADIKVYSLVSALSDVLAYYQAGTIQGALVQINRDVGSQGQANAAALGRANNTPDTPAPPAGRPLPGQVPAAPGR